MTAKKALVIGVSDYSKLQQLSFCKNDGASMSSLLSTCGYQIGNNHNLIGHVTWDNMRDAIIDFFTDFSTNPTDTLLFYYSGHGVPDVDGDVYFATSETDYDFPYKRGFSFNELAKMVQRCVSSRIVVILDCCYSGSAKLTKGQDEDKARLGTVAVNNVSRIIQGDGRCLLAASQALQEAYSLEEENHSLFTYYILQALKAKDVTAFDKDGNITVDSLSKYVYDKIMSLPSEKKPKQKPIRKIESSGDIILVDSACISELLTRSVPNAEIQNQLSTNRTPVNSNFATNVEQVRNMADRDLKSEVIQFIKRNKGNFTIAKCARELEADVEEIMRIISQIRNQ